MPVEVLVYGFALGLAAIAWIAVRLGNRWVLAAGGSLVGVLFFIGVGAFRLWEAILWGALMALALLLSWEGFHRYPRLVGRALTGRKQGRRE